MSGVIGNMTMDDLSAVRRMLRPDAEKFVEKFDLSDDERETVLELAGKDVASKPANVAWTVTRYDPYRRTWLAAAHILGASLRQLAYLHSIAPQTVLSSIDRVLPTEVRSASRIATSMKLEALSAYKAKYDENKELLANMSPKEAAEWLRDNTDLDSLDG